MVDTKNRVRLVKLNKHYHTLVNSNLVSFDCFLQDGFQEISYELSI